MFNNESEKYLDNDDSSEENLILCYKFQEIENKLWVEYDICFGDFKFNYGLGYQYVKYNVSIFNCIFISVGLQIIDFVFNFDFNCYELFVQGS